MIRQLSSCIEGAAAKRLSAVEADSERSNQHEFNGVTNLKQILGSLRETFPARFVYLGEDEAETAFADGTVTWYDARESHEIRSEFRLYFPATSISELMKEGDLLVIARRPDKTLLIIVAPQMSTAENQVRWLFDLPDNLDLFSPKEITGKSNIPLDFSARFILEELGIEADAKNDDYLDVLLDRFGHSFPSTREFSEFSREICAGVDSVGAPDEAVMSWFEKEEVLFRTLEKHIIGERLQKGFGDDVDEFVSFSLSVHQRRKSRAGAALENHMEQLIIDHGLQYSRNKITELRARPDFIFPTIEHYHDHDFPVSRLTILGVKTTAKDRWRQILPEARRVTCKHLLSLEPGISVTQTDEMIENNVQLVAPASLHVTYTARQQDWIMGVSDFVRLIQQRQL